MCVGPARATCTCLEWALRCPDSALQGLSGIAYFTTAMFNLALIFTVTSSKNAAQNNGCHLGFQVPRLSFEKQPLQKKKCAFKKKKCEGPYPVLGLFVFLQVQNSK